MARARLPASVDDRGAEIRATFERIRRPLQWPMEDFDRRRVRTARFDGFRFSRSKRKAVAGFAVGFALREDVLPVTLEPPEAVAYLFARPTGSALHRDFVLRAGSPVRRLVRESEREGLPYELRPRDEIVAFRHRSLGTVPPELFPLVASDFFLLSYRPFWASGFLERIRRPRRRR